MRPAPDPLARYWRCGGEILALGGPLPMAGRGARPLSRDDLTRLAGWHRAEMTGAGPAARRYHRLCLRDAEAVLAEGVGSGSDD